VFCAPHNIPEKGAFLATVEKITHQLNPPQKDAVLTVDGPLLILAGAGSGKTRVLTHRMAHIIAEGKAAPDEILCVTFTNKAAKEMEHRIHGILRDLNVVVRSELWISTFHSFCVRILRKHVELLDYKPFFLIYDSSDQLALIKKVMTALNINDKMYPAKGFQSKISDAKMRGLTPAEIEKTGPRGLIDPKALEVYKYYELEMKKANAFDFDDLLLKTYELFQMYPDLLSMYQDKFKYIMVDEYQDTNHIQYKLILTLAHKHQQICVVGDEDQSIYSWRGADIQNILSFERDFPKAKVVKLEENYRSSGNIVKAATNVIRNNSQRKEKELFTSKAMGDLIQVREENNEYDEARFVASTIQKMMSEGEGSYNDYAVFYRTNAQSRVLEEQLRTLAIPYRIVGGIRFYERMEIKDVLSFMRLSLNPNDDVSVKRVINVPARGIGKTTVDKLEDLSLQRKVTLLEAIDIAVNEKAFNAGTVGKLRRFADLIKDLRTQAQAFPLSEFYHIVLDKTEYLQALKNEDTPEAESRIENLEELDNAIEQFGKERVDASLQSFLEEMALVSDVDNYDQDVNAVTLMTMHISKGLEFPYVFIVGCEENLFPSGRAVESQGDEIEEERRLAYVGMTRAREKLWMTHCRMRRVWGQDQMNPPSRFLNEIPKDCVKFSSTADRSAFIKKYGMIDPNKYKMPKASDYDHHSFPDYETQGSDDGYSKGMKVRHPTFGVGSIFSVEGDGDQVKVSVMFADNTVKKFVAKYARLERV
jgi:DNA helicase-2/ATP-dependent DNA helicase PcrA